MGAEFYDLTPEEMCDLMCGNPEPEEGYCETCRFAIYDSVPYGSTYVNFLSGCKKEEEVTDDEMENNIPCSKWEARYPDDYEEKEE